MRGERDKSRCTVRKQFGGWGKLENENAMHFVKSNAIEYKRDLDKRYGEF